jgi:hypothetical protein
MRVQRVQRSQHDERPERDQHGHRTALVTSFDAGTGLDVVANRHVHVCLRAGLRDSGSLVGVRAARC